MGLKSTVGGLSLLVSVVCAVPAPAPPALKSIARDSPPKLTLLPVSASSNGGLRTSGRHIVPQKDLNLEWQTPNKDSAVSVALSMQNSAVNLEDVDDIIGVDCTGQASVAVTFNNTEAFNEAITAWSSLHDSFVMITNHMGDCDAELERGFFVADSDTLASFESNLTIVAQTEKSDVASTASSTTIDFSSVATVGGLENRDISWTDEGLTIAYNFSLPSGQTIVDTHYVTVVLNEAYVSNSVRYSGHLKWELLYGVTEFYLDVDKSMQHYAGIDVKVKAPWADSWTWSPAFTNYAVIDIPDIISLGPSAGISFGGAISSDSAVEITGDFTSKMPNGTTHVDFVDWSSSYSRGWKTEYEADFNVSESASVTLKPYIDFTVEFACKVFGGLIDLSTGIKAEPSFPLVTTVDFTQTVNTTSGNVTHPNSTALFSCANGLSEDLDFQFDVIAFATQWLDITLYEYKVDIWSGCIDWLRK